MFFIDQKSPGEQKAEEKGEKRKHEDVDSDPEPEDEVK